MDLAYKNLQWLMCHKIRPNQTKPNQVIERIGYDNLLQDNKFMQSVVKIAIEV